MKTFLDIITLFTALLLTPFATPAVAADYISEHPAAGYFPQVGEQTVADIFVAEGDWKVARVAANDLALDIKRVTGRQPALKHTAAGLSTHAVLVGIIGRSRLIDDLIKAGRLDVTDVKGQGPLDWKATASQPWIQLDRTEGRFLTEQRLWVSVDCTVVPQGCDLAAAIEIQSNGGYRRVAVPVFNPAAPARDTVARFVESHGCISMEAEHFTRRRDADVADFNFESPDRKTGPAVRKMVVSFRWSGRKARQNGSRRVNRCGERPRG